MTTLYATLADAKTVNAPQGTQTGDDAFLLQALRVVSQRIDRLMGGASRPFFAPYQETRNILVNSGNVNSWDGTLSFGGSLLALTSVTSSGSTLSIGTDVTLYPDSTQAPWSMLQLGCTYCGSWYGNCASACPSRPTVQIAGLWGYHGDYAHAWGDVDTLDGALTDSATTLKVADVDGVDSFGNVPRISAGNLLRIDSEFLEVTATNAAGNVVTVRRGVNGTTAAAHTSGTAVEAWQTEPDIREVTARQAALINSRRGKFETAQITEVGVITYPSDLLGELRGVLQGYLYVGA